jgi:ABC-2 type transport system permease protein
MAEKKKLIKGIYNWTFLIIIGVGIILINVIGSFVYKRWDITEDQRYSLSEGTIDFLKNDSTFNNRLTLKIYLDGNLPAELKHFRNAIEDKLKEFKQYAGNRIEYQFINPHTGTEGEQQELFTNLYAKGKGIMPMDVVFMKDGSQNQLLLWPGAVIEYEGSTVNNIQFLPGSSSGKPYQLEAISELIQNSINNLEYMLISSMRRAIQSHKPRVAFLQGHGELSFPQTQRARALISPFYSIADITLKDSITALDGVDGLIIARPTQAFSDKDMYLIDQFLMKGGRLMCFLDALNLSEDTLKANGVSHTTRYNLGLDKMLFDYGLKLNENYVIDARCAPRVFPFAKKGLMPWFYNVLATPTSHVISRNVEPVSLKYTSEVQFVGNSKLALTPILTSSSNSTTTGLAPMVSLGLPLNYGKTPELVPNPTDSSNQICLAGLAEGMFDSHFKNRIVDDFAKNPAIHYKDKSTQEGKVFLIGNGRFIENKYDSIPARSGDGYQYRPQGANDLRVDPELYELGIPLYFGNQDFFQNLVDYMMGDNSVLDIRSRQIDIHEINSTKVKDNAGFYKILNLLLPCGVILILAGIMGYVRKRKYAQIN